MTASPAQASPVASYARASRYDHDDRIFQSLPPLDSPEYLSFLKSAPAAELPASVLVRAYRHLHPSPAADATLARLLGHNERYGYITALYLSARRRIARLDAYTPDDLVCDTIGEIVVTLAGPMGQGADRAWVNYIHQCMERAYRRLVGRRGGRLKLRAATAVGERSERYGGVEEAQLAWADWQGSVAPSNLEWLETFLEHTAAGISEEQLRTITFNLFSHTPAPVSSGDPHDPNTLAGRFGVSRFRIYELQRQARGILLAALERQDECDIDLSFLTRLR